MITPDRDFAAAEHSDKILVAVLGRTLERATLQLVLLWGGLCAVGAALALFAT